MSNKLNVIAIIEGKNTKELNSKLINLVNESRKEAGCEKYELQQDNENKNRFFMIETWTREEDLNNHIATKHFQDFVEFSKENNITTEPIMTTIIA